MEYIYTYIKSLIPKNDLQILKTWKMFFFSIEIPSIKPFFIYFYLYIYMYIYIYIYLI